MRSCSISTYTGSKYNTLVKTHQALRSDCEVLRKKCAEVCTLRYETLKKKYTDEREERKRLYNEIIELKGNIRVFCRCRPLSSEEIAKGYSCVVDFDPAQDMELQITCSDSSKKQFKFDHVFGPKDDQDAVFAETLPIVKSVLDGYNVCIFAYGQTGAGKTFTMEGTPENRGVNYRALEELFRISDQRSSITRYEFYFSMLEVYNEKIRDLLAGSSDQLLKSYLQAEKLLQEEKENAKLNESLQLMHLKYASRENVYKTLQEKVRDLENQLADEKKANKDTAKFSKPPLAPMKQRPPLRRINNLLPPPGPQTVKIAYSTADKENDIIANRTSGRDLVKPLNKARRISLATSVRNVPMQNKRASIAVVQDVTERTQTLPGVRQWNHITGTTQLRNRRSSVSTFMSLTATPLEAAASPDITGKFSAFASNSKQKSPPLVQALWKSRLPGIASPRKRLRLMSSPATSRNLNAAQSCANKLCFSVQKRVIVGSPAPTRPVMNPGSMIYNQLLRDKDLVGRFGTAQRVLCKNRRQSVI
ncbi:hypothetical protein B296_00012760 [Ensete ventricosum]|uniref:Kinesin motor domain-containing protein n=1 Tax=Ensete ventricosum TaxID=4639 RepID=A0A427B8Q9_ENSVE|nr:hypothetical protein B296_00012760 [Ensete ventricosum]